ncbi:tRNA uridine-5-carboxymethylaminomethyl(34) synthesis GTPase MnmE [Mycoplasma sp. 3341]|uniref:tRNA uridine-5-carboxymethylaminomethyl(34) synthesis GTPase MnmE n=1 Tax=Mycoplasma sp. 3341 TaxID=3447506 RepID=UPI003F654DF1
MWDTITAISSGKINQAVSIIRICGPEAINIIKKIFRGKEGKNKEITFGSIFDGNQKIDEVLVAWFPGTQNYIGEDTVEINAHGGVVVSNMILELILRHGARIADPGEFSRRAYLNGKIDLIKAEAINDLIHAKSEKQVKMSVNKFDNRLSNKITAFLNEIEYLIGNCEVNIDYPEITDIEVLTNETLLPKIKSLIKGIDELIKVSSDAQKVYEGIKVAIVGRPNAGKSSLLNCLLQEEKAIVTEIAGTTRDAIEAQFQLDGVLFNLIDTAGIRDTEDIVEKIGIQKAKQTIEKSDLVIHVVDQKEKWNEIDEQIKQLAKEKIYLQALNKTDLITTNKISHEPNQALISAKNNEIESLLDLIKQQFANIDFNNPDLIYNTRQLSLIKSAKNNLSDALDALEQGFGTEVIVVDLTEAWKAVSSIIGKGKESDLLDSIFSNFCLGK